MLTFLCALTVAALFPLAAMVSAGLPADTRAHIAEKYAGWNGVLEIWLGCGWNAGGSISAWVKDCIAGFEAEHGGVYLELRTMDADILGQALNSAQRKPELILFSPGALGESSSLTELAIPDMLRTDLHGCGCGFALPVAMGGYIAAENPAAAADAVLFLENTPAEAIIALSGGAATIQEYEVPGLDLGLAASADVSPLRSADALEQFTEGRLRRLIVSQAELGKLNRLRQEGLGPDWECMGAGSIAFTDQLLMAARPRLNGEHAAERSELAGSFIDHLLSEDCQNALMRQGLLSVTGRPIHTADSVYAPLDYLLCALPLSVPDAFSEYSPGNGDAIVRRYLRGECSHGEAMAALGLSGA